MKSVFQISNRQAEGHYLLGAEQKNETHSQLMNKFKGGGITTCQTSIYQVLRHLVATKLLISKVNFRILTLTLAITMSMFWGGKVKGQAPFYLWNHHYVIWPSYFDHTAYDSGYKSQCFEVIKSGRLTYFNRNLYHGVANQEGTLFTNQKYMGQAVLPTIYYGMMHRFDSNMTDISPVRFWDTTLIFTPATGTGLAVFSGLNFTLEDIEEERVIGNRRYTYLCGEQNILQINENYGIVWKYDNLTNTIVWQKRYYKGYFKSINVVPVTPNSQDMDIYVASATDTNFNYSSGWHNIVINKINGNNGTVKKTRVLKLDGEGMPIQLKYDSSHKVLYLLGNQLVNLGVMGLIKAPLVAKLDTNLNILWMNSYVLQNSGLPKPLNPLSITFCKDSSNVNAFNVYVVNENLVDYPGQFDCNLNPLQRYQPILMKIDANAGSLVTQTQIDINPSSVSNSSYHLNPTFIDVPYDGYHTAFKPMLTGNYYNYCDTSFQSKLPFTMLFNNDLNHAYLNLHRPIAIRDTPNGQVGTTFKWFISDPHNYGSNPKKLVHYGDNKEIGFNRFDNFGSRLEMLQSTQEGDRDCEYNIKPTFTRVDFQTIPQSTFTDVTYPIFNAHISTDVLIPTPSFLICTNPREGDYSKPEIPLFNPNLPPTPIKNSNQKVIIYDVMGRILYNNTTILEGNINIALSNLIFNSPQGLYIGYINSKPYRFIKN